MVEYVKGLACLVLLAIVGWFTFAALKTPMPDGVSVSSFIDRSLRGSVAYFDIYVLGGDQRIDGARELMGLDPELSGPGEKAATIVATESSDPAERVHAAETLLAHVGASQNELRNALNVAVRTGDPQLTDRALQRASETGNRSLVRSVTRTVAAELDEHDHDANLLTVALASVNANPSSLTPASARLLAEAVLARHRSDLLQPAVHLAGQVLGPLDRKRFAKRLLDDQVAAWAGGADVTTQLALSLARTPLTLNNRAVVVSDQTEAGALLTEAHTLAPNDAIIAANWADVEKRLAATDADPTLVPVYNQLLDRGLAIKPNVASWRDARQLTIAPLTDDALVLACCSCS